MPTPQTEKAPALDIRIQAIQRALIERGARQANKSISDSVRDAAIQEAESTLLDTTRIERDPAAWEQFAAALDAPRPTTPGCAT